MRVPEKESVVQSKKLEEAKREEKEEEIEKDERLGENIPEDLKGMVFRALGKLLILEGKGKCILGGGEVRMGVNGECGYILRDMLPFWRRDLGGGNLSISCPSSSFIFCTK